MGFLPEKMIIGRINCNPVCQTIRYRRQRWTEGMLEFLAVVAVVVMALVEPVEDHQRRRSTILSLFLEYSWETDLGGGG